MNNREITLSTGKKVQVKELNAYQSYMINSFLTGTVNADEIQGGQIPASVAFQMGTLETLFKASNVNGKKIKTPTNRKELIEAFSHFTSAELNELSTELAPKKKEKGEIDEKDEESSNPLNDVEKK